MTEFNLINLKEFKESNMLSIVDGIETDIAEGNAKALPQYVQAKALEFLSKKIIDRIKDPAMDEAETFGKNDSIFNGASFALNSTGILLNYSDDAEYRKLEKELKARKDRLKEAYDMKQKGHVLVDEATGEELPVVSIKKHAEQIIKVSFK